jgi:leader peptidase (prepilin peptidase)/N-methyltransferase
MPELPFALWIVLAAVLGLLVGSFLNVVILRLPERMAAVWRREARDVLELQADDEPLPPGIVREPALDNIPLFGWLLLRGRCRYCQTKISIQYPLVELLSGVLSALIILKFGPTWMGLAGLAFTWTLIALAGIDFRTQLLPDQLTLPLLWLGLLLSLLPMVIDAPAAILAAAIGYLGAWMGPVAILPIVLLSSLIGALVGGGLIALRQHEREIPMPFGPFIAAAGWVWFVAGPHLLDGYLHLTGMR